MADKQEIQWETIKDYQGQAAANWTAWADKQWAYTRAKHPELTTRDIMEMTKLLGSPLTCTCMAYKRPTEALYAISRAITPLYDIMHIKQYLKIWWDNLKSQ